MIVRNIGHLAAVNVIANICYSIIAPILPLELELAGISEAWNGVIFAAYALADVITSLLLPVVARGWSKKGMILTGMVMMGTSIAGYAGVMGIGENWVIVGMAIGLRMVQGAAASVMS